jgi:hypothetical protein
LSTAICPTCVGKHSERVAGEGSWVRGFAEMAIKESAEIKEKGDQPKSCGEEYVILVLN